MNRNTTFLYKTLIVGVIILLIGTSVVTSAENRAEDITTIFHIPESLEVTKDLYSHRKIAYAFCINGGQSQLEDGTVYFYLDDPGNVTQICSSMSGDLLVGGTWTNDWRWLTWNYASGGILCEAFPCGCWTHFGGGGFNLNSLAFDPVTEKLYGASNIALYEVNIDMERFQASLINRKRRR